MSTGSDPGISRQEALDLNENSPFCKGRKPGQDKRM